LFWGVDILVLVNYEDRIPCFLACAEIFCAIRIADHLVSILGGRSIVATFPKRWTQWRCPGSILEAGRSRRPQNVYTTEHQREDDDEVPQATVYVALVAIRT
jgi:hypothetical protein